MQSGPTAQLASHDHFPPACHGFQAQSHEYRRRARHFAIGGGRPGGSRGAAELHPAALGHRQPPHDPGMAARRSGAARRGAAATLPPPGEGGGAADAGGAGWWASHCAALCPHWCWCCNECKLTCPNCCHVLPTCRASCPPAALNHLPCRPTPFQPFSAGWTTTACSARCRCAGRGTLPAQTRMRLEGCGSSSAPPGGGDRRPGVASSTSTSTSHSTSHSKSAGGSTTSGSMPGAAMTASSPPATTLCWQAHCACACASPAPEATKAPAPATACCPARQPSASAA